jgi:hypothetical protein
MNIEEQMTPFACAQCGCRITPPIPGPIQPQIAGRTWLPDMGESDMDGFAYCSELHRSLGPAPVDPRLWLDRATAETVLQLLGRLTPEALGEVEEWHRSHLMEVLTKFLLAANA